ncbi:MAG: protoglobin domain-containing protein [Planctomycetota bacterium]|nr:protoglobin domain-containing protein [Planctomycetota bacterium]
MPGPAQPEDIQKQLEIRKKFLRITEEDEETLRKLGPVLKKHAPGVVTAFYDHLLRFPELKVILDRTDMGRLKGILVEYLLSLSESRIDRAYFERRLSIGRTHVRVGLEPQWFLGAYGFFLSSLVEAFATEPMEDSEEAARAIIAIQKAMILDVNIALDAYHEMIQQEELKRTEARHWAIVETATDLIWAFTPDRRMTYVNRGLCGHSRDDFLKGGLSLLESLHTPESKEKMRVAIDHIATTRAGVENVPSTLIHPDTLKREHYLSNLSPIFGDDMELIRVQVITRDVTEVRKLEQKVLDRERLATVGLMAANVAHEIRNPLAGIKGALETLRPKFRGTPRDDAILTEILDRIDVLNVSVQDLLIFSRPLVLEKVRISLKTFCDEVVALLREDPAFAEVTVDVVVPDELDVLLDPQQGKLAFTNLLLNSAQAMDQAGRIRLVARPLQETVEIAIEDTGPGIPQSVRDEIFNPFFTTKANGTGLGLSIVRWIIEAHEGAITLDPSAKEGSRVLISLPIH